MNDSKKRDPRFWKKWRESGAVGTIEPTSIDQRSFTLPDRQTMLIRLLNVNDENHLRDNFYPLLLKHAGTSKVPAGVVMILALAIHDYTDGMPAAMHSLLLMQIDDFVDAICGKRNKAAAEKAKEHFHNVMEINSTKAAEAREIARPAREAREVEGMSPEKQATLNAAKKIADLIFEYATPNHLDDDREKPWMDDRRNESINPFYNQTKSGLFLEFYYGMPSSLWTPLGKYGFGGSGSGSWEKLLPEILKRLGATVHTPVRYSNAGEHGPVYAIHEIDGEKIPEPITCPRDEYLEYDIAKQEWEEFCKTLAVA